MYQPQDYIQQIADHLKKNLSKGYTIDALRVSLTKQGYSKISIEKAIDLANHQLAAKAPPLKEKPHITYKILDENNHEANIFSSRGFGKKFWRWIFGR
jgi:hypothetical protein